MKKARSSVPGASLPYSGILTRILETASDAQGDTRTGHF